MRKFLIALALLLAIFFIITRFTEVQRIAETFQQGDWRFLLLAVIVELAWLVNVGASYRAIYHILGLEENRERLMRLAAAASFFNVVAPTGGMSALVVFIADARKYGYSSAKATIAGALYVLFDYLGFITILAIGLVILFERNHLNWAEIVATCILIIFALGIATLLYLGTRSAKALGDVLAWIGKHVNLIVRPFIHRDYLSIDRAHSFAIEAADGISALKREPRNALLPIALALSNKALLISILFLSFLSFKVPFETGTLIAGFSIAYLFLIVSPTPQGLGVVEGALALSLNSLGVALEPATVIVIAYRAITFWMPFFYGMVSFRSMGRVRDISRAGIN